MWWKRKCVRRRRLPPLIFAPECVRMNAAASPSLSLVTRAEIDSEIEPHRMADAGSGFCAARRSVLSIISRTYTRVWLIAAAFLLSLITPAGQRSSWQFLDAARMHWFGAAFDWRTLSAHRQWKHTWTVIGKWVGGRGDSIAFCEARPTCDAHASPRSRRKF